MHLGTLITAAHIGQTKECVRLCNNVPSFGSSVSAISASQNGPMVEESGRIASTSPFLQIGTSPKSARAVRSWLAVTDVPLSELMYEIDSEYLS